MKYPTFSTKFSHLLTAAGVSAAAIAFVLIPKSADAALYRELSIGMSGSDVSELQTFLARDPNVYPQGLVTGYFGSLTRAAVTAFQAKNGIATVGRVGPITMAAINAQEGNGAVGGFDTTAPVQSGAAISVTSNSASLNWNTNENTAAILYFSTSPIRFIEASMGTGVTVSGTGVLANTDLRTAHSATLTGLLANTTYNYVLYVRDGSGNETISWPATFVTTQ